MDKQLKVREPGLWEIQDGHLAFPDSLTDLICWVKALPGYSVNAPTVSSLSLSLAIYIYIYIFTEY